MSHCSRVWHLCCKCLAKVLNCDLQAVQRSVCQRDGRWFLKLLQAETDRMEGWCRQMQLEQQENALSEDSRCPL